ncbi:MAG: ATP-binding protein [Candidatus Thermoplasmatota archaeon]|nr:ATP-binding protein [Candidatus Thermoplasmatota archaeon]
MGPNNSGKSALLSVVDFYRSSLWDYPGFRPVYSNDIISWMTPDTFAYRQTDIEAIRFEIGFRSMGDMTLVVSLEGGRWGLTVPPEEADMIHEKEIQEAIRSIWHLRPVRPELPPSQVVGVGRSQFQPLRPDGGNVIEYLLEQWTSRNPLWDEAERWLRRIDPHMDLLSVPLRGNQASIETVRSYGNKQEAEARVNLAHQGTGMQSVSSVVAALVFSIPGSIIIIEEPEAYLHPRSQEVIVDLMNKAVNEWKKQVIVSTHSWDMILPFISDIGTGTQRGTQHVKADPEKFSLVMIDDEHSIKAYDLRGKTFKEVRDRTKTLWG